MSASLRSRMSRWISAFPYSDLAGADASEQARLAAVACWLPPEPPPAIAWPVS